MITIIMGVYRYYIKRADGTTTEHEVKASNQLEAGEKVLENHSDKELYSSFGGFSVANWGWIADACIIGLMWWNGII